MEQTAKNIVASAKKLWDSVVDGGNHPTFRSANRTNSTDKSYGIDRIIRSAYGKFTWDVLQTFCFNELLTYISNSTYAQNMRTVQFLLLACAVGSATTLTNSNFGSGDPNVVGDALYFDTQSISVSVNTSTDQVTAVIDLDFGDGQSSIEGSAGAQYLASFTESGVPGRFNIGDLFFYDPASPTTPSCSNGSDCVTVPTPASLAYGVVLDGGGSSAAVNANLSTGDLYAIDGSTVTTETAGTAYDQNDIYRPSQVVDLTGTSGATPAETGTESICTSGPGCQTNGAQYQVTLNFSVPTAFLSLMLNGPIGIEFSAADCGNAVLAGVVTAATTTPEPGTLGMIAAGIGMLAFGLVRRRRKK
ncbi:MAG: PEP-CTERM sorting domain-containing protein [Bryobacteraceae bacterium]